MCVCMCVKLYISVRVCDLEQKDNWDKNMILLEALMHSSPISVLVNPPYLHEVTGFSYLHLHPPATVPGLHLHLNLLSLSRV